MKTALIAGHTGLIGSQLLTLLLTSEQYDRVIAIGRSSVDIRHPKLIQQIVDFNNLELEEEKIDDVYCALGTTMKKAGSKDKFRLVDFQFPVNMAGYLLKKGAQRFLLVSSMGADESSNIFYNQVKGEVEHAISKIGYTRLDIFRPSLLLGPRGESRFAEDIGKAAMKLFGFLFIGPLKDYRAIESSKVAAAMLYYAQEDGVGNHVHLSGELQNFS
jgi:nucleoside-diphosphate-sugar epimerase